MTAEGYPRSQFLGDAFDARSFVTWQMDKHQLDDVVENLKCTVQDLTDELLALIDRDHQTFLELSGDLVRVDSTVGTLRGPLVNLKQRVEAVRKVTLAPQELCDKYDEDLTLVRQRKRELQQRMFARDARRSVESNLQGHNVHRAAQRVALLLAANNNHGAATEGEGELKRKVESILVDKLWSTVKDEDEDELRRRLRSLVMMNGMEAVRRTLQQHCLQSTAEDNEEAVLLTRFAPVLRAAALENLGTVFELPHQLLMSTAANKPATSSAEYRALERHRQRMAMLSPTHTPHATWHWNPRAHCELRFQDASEVLVQQAASAGGDELTLSVLQRAMDVLLEQDAPPTDGDSSDALLHAHLFRMGVKLVAGYLHHHDEQSSSSSSSSVQAALAQTKDAFALKQALVSGQVLPPLAPAAATLRIVDRLSARAHTLAVRYLNSTQQQCTDQCVRELSAHERAVTAKYRMSGRELAQEESATAGKVLASLLECYDELGGGKVDDDDLRHFCVQVVGEVRAQYMQMADTVVRRETSLLKLHQSRLGANAGGATSVMSDSHKIVKQLKMDCDRFVSDVRAVLGEQHDVVAECEAVVAVFAAF